MQPDQVIALIQKEVKKVLNDSGYQIIHPSQLSAKIIKQKNIDGMIIVRGLAAKLPTNGATGIMAYFAYDTKTLYIWDGATWRYQVLT